MKKAFVILFMGMILLVTACQKNRALEGSAAAAEIPAEMDVVAAIDMDRLMEKSSYQDALKLPMFQTFLSELEKEAPSVTSMIKAPEQSGINILEKSFWAADLPGIKQCLYLPVADPAKVDQLFSDEATGRSLSVQQYEGWKMLDISKRARIRWNDRMLLLDFYQGDTIRDSGSDNRSQGLLANSNFEDFVKSQDADVGVWVSSNPFLEKWQTQMPWLFLTAEKEDLKDNFAHLFLNFEEGEVLSEVQFFLKKRLQSDLAILIEQDLPKELLSNIPETALSGIGAVGINLDGLNQLLLEKYSKSTMDVALQKAGVSFDDLRKSFSGQVAIAMYEGDAEFPAAYAIGLDVRSPSDLSQMVEKAMARQYLKKLNDKVFEMTDPQDSTGQLDSSGIIMDRRNGYLFWQDTKVFLTNQQWIIEELQSGRAKYKANVMEGQSFFGFANLETMAKVDKEPLPVQFVQFTGTIEKVTGRAKMKNAKDNSLNYLIHWANAQYEKREER